MAQLSAGIINLQAATGGYPHVRNGRVFQLCGELVETRRHLSANWQQAINMAEDNRWRLKQMGLRTTKSL
jgi:hypothetical protein